MVKAGEVSARKVSLFERGESLSVKKADSHAFSSSCFPTSLRYFASHYLRSLVWSDHVPLAAKSTVTDSCSTFRGDVFALVTLCVHYFTAPSRGRGDTTGTKPRPRWTRKRGVALSTRSIPPSARFIALNKRIYIFKQENFKEPLGEVTQMSIMESGAPSSLHPPIALPGRI